MTVDVFKEKCGYEIEGAWLPRVTAILSMNRSPARQEFAEKPGYTLFSRLGLLQAAEWGTAIHEAIGKIIKKEKWKPDPKIAPAMKEFQRWYEEHPFKLLDPGRDIERRVFDKGNQYAGTVDLVVQAQGQVGIMDIKTTTEMLKGHLLQTAAYLNAYQKSVRNGLHCEARWILRIDQYQECLGCFAKKREKYGRSRTSGGNPLCNHQWGPVKGEVEMKQLENYQEDLEAFFETKARWEQKYQDLLLRIPNYPKNNKQLLLL